MRSKLPSFIRLRSSAYHKYSSQHLVHGQELNLSHLKIFGCALYVPIAPLQRTKMGPQRRMEFMLDLYAHQLSNI